MRRLVSFLPGEIRLFGHLTRLKMLYYMCDLREGIGSPLGNGVAKLWGVQDTPHEAVKLNSLQLGSRSATLAGIP
jgi:hypothetical protein